MIRPTPAFTASLSSAARTSFRSQLPQARSMATESGKGAAASSSSNAPLILALAGLGGLGAWYGMGGFSDKNVPTEVQEKAKDAVERAGQAAGLGALNKDKFVEFTLRDIKPYNHDSSFFIFDLPDNKSSGMTVASAVVVKGAGEEGLKGPDGKQVIRPYTPVSSPDTQGHIDFLIKKYENGNMTKHIHSMKPGDKLAIKGPIPKWPYKANEFDEIALVAGGSGITPMWQVMQQIASDPKDKTKVTLLYSNKSESDILLREEFDKLAKTDERFKVVYGLDKAPKGWTGFEGYVTPEILTKYLPLPAKAEKVKIFVCGPPPQVESISGNKVKGEQGPLKGLLADLGYTESQVYKF